jgi:hypothetical protein
MKKILPVLMVAAFIAGCGQDKFSPPATAGDGPTLVADHKDVKPPPKKKIPKKPVVKPQVQEPAPQPVVAAPAPVAPVAVVPQPAPVKVEPPKPVKPVVVGMRTNSRTAAQLFDWGTGRALSDAAVCANSYFIPDSGGHSPCFLIYNNGLVTPASPYNKADGNAYVEEVRKLYEAEQKAEKEKKEAKKLNKKRKNN